jgi:hypothetical protein
MPLPPLPGKAVMTASVPHAKPLPPIMGSAGTACMVTGSYTVLLVQPAGEVVTA